MRLRSTWLAGKPGLLIEAPTKAAAKYGRP